MGQAKIRKHTDPNYGKPSTMRGLIISPPIEMTSTHLTINTDVLDEQDLRTSLLYWDRLLYPQNPIFRLGTNQDEEFLITCGILKKPLYNVKSGGTDIFLKAQTMALLDMQKKEPGVWSLNSNKNTILVNSGLATKNSGLLLQLLNAVPVPSHDIPLAEILEFKQRRRDELLAFRAHFEAMANSIQNSSDSEQALQSRLEEIDKSCSDLVRTTREWQYPIKLASVNASFNFDLPKAFTTAVSTWVASGQIELGLTSRAVASGAAAISSQFKVSRDISFRPFTTSPSPYRYAYSIERDL